MKNRNEELKRKLKKAASISLCAVLAGGLAAGTYTGVNYLTGYEQSVQAASEDKVELLKSEKKSDDSQDDSKDESTAKGSLDASFRNHVLHNEFRNRAAADIAVANK